MCENVGLNVGSAQRLEKVGLNDSGGIDRVFKPTFSKISRFMHPNPRNVSLKVVNEAATLENVGLKGVYELATLEVSA